MAQIAPPDPTNGELTNPELTNPAQFKAIADAIRAKTGETGTIVANDFAEKIAAIPTGVAKPSWVQSTLPASKRWTSVCYGNGKFVAVSRDISNLISGEVMVYGGLVAYSTNGVTWIQTTLPTHGNLYSVYYGNGKFVTVFADSNIAAYLKDYFDEWA